MQIWDQVLGALPRKQLALALGTARSGLYVAEAVPLIFLRRLQGAGPGPAPDPPQDFQREIANGMQSLLQWDAENIEAGLYPLSVLAPEGPWPHAQRFLRILADSLGVSRRRQREESSSFEGQAQQWLDDLPAYYRRNFHFQTDGYLSDTSAELYEHQVQLLFRGSADAMRRLIIPPLKRHFSGSTGSGLHFLELGSGCGTATRFAAQAFPDAKFTCLDLSYPYLRRAQWALRALPRVDFAQGDASELDFRDERFDAVYSVFLLHELPLRVREAVLRESVRVCRRGGMVTAVDSVQLGDAPSLDWAIQRFPVDFHEPYFANYIENPTETLFEKAGLPGAQSERGFLSKATSAVAPAG